MKRSRLACAIVGAVVVAGLAGAESPVEGARPITPPAAVADAAVRETRPPADRATLALEDPDPSVRLRSISALIRDGGSEAVEALSAVALFDTLWSVRHEAVRGLGEIGSEASIPALEQASLDADRRVRRAAIEAITEIGGDQAALALVFALIGEDPALREDAVLALGDIGGPIAIGILRHALKDEQPSVRESAAEALEDLGEAESEPSPAP